eukprot:TRINITY_DN33252_c0_g1_i1.p1 TRINITY_DN33252_c0_g1~~TRINITY_DN33252_c0_g1_i1.p1  ORF type:complete len:358 (-),score=39.83 TRINITY_DN33252_c0_g1_i1:140-1213(-)
MPMESLFFLRGESTPDKLILFSLLNSYLPFLHQLLCGIKLPASDMAPYGHHNAIQLAIKKPGYPGYDKLENMPDAFVGHIDQSASKQKDGTNTTNYSVLFGIVLAGATGDRDDAGNLYVAPRSYRHLADAFNKFEGDIAWYGEKKISIAKKYLQDTAPGMKAVRVKPGQCIVMHHQTIHGVGPNCTSTDRVVIYFRVTSEKRPDGKKNCYPEAMRDPTLETPNIHPLAQLQTTGFRIPHYFYGKTVLITSHRGRNLQDSNGDVKLHSNTGSWERWTISDAGNGQVTIKSHQNNLLWDNGGNVELKNEVCPYWTIVEAGNGKVRIKSHTGKNLQDNHGNVRLHSNSLAWEQWTIRDIS